MKTVLKVIKWLLIFITVIVIVFATVAILNMMSKGLNVAGTISMNVVVIIMLIGGIVGIDICCRRKL